MCTDGLFRPKALRLVGWPEPRRCEALGMMVPALAERNHLGGAVGRVVTNKVAILALVGPLLEHRRKAPEVGPGYSAVSGGGGDIFFARVET